ncbi:MAG: septal ring lytic transglycosylase RlpA family lipoprotein [Nitrospira sp. LK265]|nr:septal ring lytic transglycosylase RlpA family protein [Nitrospira sp.]NGZ61552.1 septal ring lytic transglycosylase RlpA family lipoprotein [Nitrospira sp. LK265]
MKHCPSILGGVCERLRPNRLVLLLLLLPILLTFESCSVIEGTFSVIETTFSVIKIGYRVVKNTVKGTIWVVSGTYELTKGATHLVYHIGEFTFEVVRAPLDYPLIRDDIQTIDGLPVKEAIRLGRVKTAPYTVKGQQYVPMTVARAQTYEETGLASWYGEETRRLPGGHMTANGELFNPNALTAAHKYLPLPIHVQVTNLENGKSIIVRVNDRGPFPSQHNPDSGKRIIDLSRGAAERLGFVEQGVAKVHVETIQLEEA